MTRSTTFWSSACENKEIEESIKIIIKIKTDLFIFRYPFISYHPFQLANIPEKHNANIYEDNSSVFE